MYFQKLKVIVKTLNPQKTIFLVDGSSFLYRAYYGLRPMHTSKGLGVQAVYGFCRMIKKLTNQFSPEYFAVVWDSKGATVRHEMFSEYKATRQAAPSDLFEQKEYIQEFARATSLKQVEVPGIEADDLMYSIAQDFHMHDFTTILVTSDKDMGQSVSEDIFLFDPFKEIIIDSKNLEEKYGFPVEKLPFYFALIGDASDNIPGVRGIGPKGAQALVNQFVSLEDLYNNLDKVPKERTRELLIAARESAFLSYELFLLRYYDLNIKKDDFKYDAHNWANARKIFEELEFKSLLASLPQEAAAQQELFSLQKKYNFIAITTQEQLEQVCQLITQKKLCALDTETDGLRPLQANMVGVSLCVEEGTAYYIPANHMVIARLNKLFEDISIKVYMHHAKFDLMVCAHAGITIKGLVFDTLLAASLVTQDWQRIGLKYLSDFYLHEKMLSFDDVVKKNGYKNFAQVPLELATEYAAADAHQTLRLVPILENELATHEQKNLYYTIEFPLIKILLAMEKEGILLDKEVLKTIDIQVTRELDILRTHIIDLVGEHYAHINLNSPKQLEELLFVELKLTPQKKTTQKTGYSTDQEVLQELAKVHPVPALIIKYRELFKLKSTYIDALGSFVNPQTGRIHTTFSQISTATGRLASSEPNLQNIPVESTTEVHIRSAFKAPAGYMFLSADYSQIELRVLAYLSQDQTLKTAFLAGEDIHARTASGLFDVPLTHVTHDQRQVAKRINFSILYGLTPYGLSKDLDINFNTAKLYIEKYLAQYPGVMSWMEQVIREVYDKGYVTTLWGRRRYLPGIYEKNKSLYELARRMAINTKAQGTAAELMKIGMINVDTVIREKNLGAKMILQIHDELLIAVPDNQVNETQNIIAQTLQNVVQWDVPLLVTTRTGKDWYEVTK